MTNDSDAKANPQDPLGYGWELYHAKRHPALKVFHDEGVATDEHARHAAYVVAKTLGYCRLYGVELAEEDCVMPPSMALAAIDDLNRLLTLADKSLQDFDHAFDVADSDLERHALAANLLRSRMHAWAVYVAIDETRTECLIRLYDDGEPQPLLPRLEQAIANLSGGLATFDTALQSHRDALSILTETELLENWRGLLTDSYDPTNVWWLDGSLEQAHHRAVAAAKKVVPTQQWWDRIFKSRLAKPRPPFSRQNRETSRKQFLAMGAASQSESRIKRVIWKDESGRVAQLSSPESQVVLIEFETLDNDKMDLARQAVEFAQTPQDRQRHLLREETDERAIVRITSARWDAIEIVCNGTPRILFVGDTAIEFHLQDK